MTQIKLVCFDLDGVLADSRELHYVSLNMALEEVAGPEFIINREEHLSTFDGLTTTKKLRMLTERKGLPVELHNEVWAMKQVYTRESIFSLIGEDYKKMHLFEQLKSENRTIAVCSNSVRRNVILILSQLGLLPLVDYIYSNEDVRHTKPHGEIYMKAMLDAGANATETLIVEDSHVGRTAAMNSGAHLCAVRNPSDVNMDNIIRHIERIEDGFKRIRPKWQGGKMNVLIPMAGAGSRFQAAGYTFPKPLIEVEGKPMIQLVTENLNIDARHIYIVQKEHYEKYNLKQLLNLISPGCEIVQVDGLTEGAACTTLLAKEFIDNDEPLVIANSDQYLDWNSNEFMYAMLADTVDAGILTFTATHPKWSFAKLGPDGFVTEVAEKQPISDIATVGVYYWARGADYVKYAEQMIADNVRVNNEFYVCPVFNHAIADGKKVKTYRISQMWGIGTPEDLQTFLQREQ
jgi:HAD superfamily hydrolase (TIGR01509 family)